MTEKLKLLIVDDSFIIRQAIKKYLKKYNLEVVGTAENGKIALELFEKTNPDIVTLDTTMPEIDGLTVLEEMISALGLSGFKAVLCTAFVRAGHHIDDVAEDLCLLIQCNNFVAGQ